MTHAEFTHAWQLHTHQRVAQSRNRQLAEILALEAFIQPDARQLVSVLGKRGDRNNLDALTTWIARELAHLDLSGIDPLDYLYARLSMRIERWHK